MFNCIEKKVCSFPVQLSLSLFHIDPHLSAGYELQAYISNKKVGLQNLSSSLAWPVP